MVASLKDATIYMNYNFSDFSNFNFINFDPVILKTVQNNMNKKLKIIDSYPSIKEYNDVIYTPYEQFKDSAKFQGFLYNEEGKIIEESRLVRGLNILGDERIDIPENLEFLNKKVLYLGHINGHYGHFILESLSRSWSILMFSSVCQEFDNFLVHSNPSNQNLPFVVKILSLLGVDLDKVIYFSKTIKIKSVFIPELSYSVKNYMYTAYKNTFEPIHKIYQEVKITEQPLYLSRSLLGKKSRTLQEERELEEIFIKNGFNVIHPQYLSTEEQLFLFNRHKYIVSQRGSALFNIVFSGNRKTIFHLSSQDDFINKLKVPNAPDLPVSTSQIFIEQVFGFQAYYINTVKLKFNRVHNLLNKLLINNLTKIRVSNYTYHVDIGLALSEFKKIGLLDRVSARKIKL